MQPTLERFWNLHFAKFPLEIIQQITDFLPQDSITLQNLRLTCSTTFHPATDSMFREIRLPANANAFQRAIEVLSSDRIAPKIRYLEIPAESFIPRANIRKVANDFYQLVAVETLSHSQLANTFTARLCRLVSAAIIIGFWQKHPIIEEAFITCIAESLATFELGYLQELTLDLVNINAAARLWGRYYGGAGAVLVKNLLSLKRLTLTNFRRLSHHVDFNSFISWVGGNLNLSKLEIQTRDDANLKTMIIAPCGQLVPLTNLTLSDLAITDNFTRTLERLKGLRKLHLHSVEISKDQDRWSSVFGVCRGFTGLEQLYFMWIRYSDAEEVCDDTEGAFCSPFRADMHGAKSLNSLVKDLVI